jgi:hypothetical protein
MKLELLQDLITLHKKMTGIKSVTWKRTHKPVILANELIDIIVKHATKDDLDKLAVCASSNATKPAKRVKAKPVTCEDDVVTVVLGPYGTDTQARAEARQFQHPNVFAYRSAIFPHPGNYHVTVRVLESVVVSPNTKTTLYPFAVQLRIKVDGTANNVRSWIKTFKDRVRPLTIM